MQEGDVEQDREGGKKSLALSDFAGAWKRLWPSLSPPAKKLETVIISVEFLHAVRRAHQAPEDI